MSELLNFLNTSNILYYTRMFNTNLASTSSFPTISTWHVEPIRQMFCCFTHHRLMLDLCKSFPQMAFGHDDRKEANFLTAQLCITGKQLWRSAWYRLSYISNGNIPSSQRQAMCLNPMKLADKQVSRKGFILTNSVLQTFVSRPSWTDLHG